MKLSAEDKDMHLSKKEVQFMPTPGQQGQDPKQCVGVGSTFL